MNDFSSIQHRAQIIPIQSDAFDKLLTENPSPKAVLVIGHNVALQKDDSLPNLAELKSWNYNLSENRHTAVRVGRYLFLLAQPIVVQKNQPAFATATPELPSLLKSVGLRQAFDVLPEIISDDFLLGAQLIHWSEGTLFCSRCGESLVISKVEIAKICSHCERNTYPNLNPVVITLIYRKTPTGYEFLLGRGLSPRPYYSCLAGFVEAGETLEKCLKREVFEEVGVFVHNLQYFASQPWPFPGQLMVGFSAEWESGEIRIDKNELSDAQWFSIKNLPTLPAKASLARKMIDAFLEQNADPK